MQAAFCTITSTSHLFKTRALIESVKNSVAVDFYVLLTDGDLPPFTDATYIDLKELKSEVAARICKKYKSQPDNLRWALKPVLMLELLAEKCDKIIYVDNDICFFSSPEFILRELDNAAILLTPHYYSAEPTKNAIWFEANYWIGLYNAGFIAASQKGLPALNWWAQCCLYNMSLESWRGLFVDQKYLDAMPIAFDNVMILKHKGCNVAGWNMELCIRKQVDKSIVIEPDFPIVFIHFTSLFFANIKNGKDPLLNSYHDDYVELLKKYNPSFNINSQFKRKKRDYYFIVRYLFWKLARLTEHE